MINSRELLELAKVARVNQRVPHELRGYILQSVHDALTEVYGNNYSDRCVQASLAIERLHKELGLTAQTYVGDACLAKYDISNDSQRGWTGFGNRDYHAWVKNEFHELIDLTVSQLHIHPKNRHYTDEPIPAFWWAPIEVLPPAFVYLPKGPLQTEFSPDEQSRLDRLLREVVEIATKNASLVGQNQFENVIHGVDHFDQLKLERSNSWVNKCQNIQLSLPGYIKSRIMCLNEQCAPRDSTLDSSDPKERRKARQARDRRLEQRRNSKKPRNNDHGS